MKTTTTHLSCACGALRLEVHGTPIISAECHCKSCSDAARRLETLPVPGAIQTIHGGTRYVLYRKDRISLLSGTENLREFRLGPNASTRRVLASCCNTPVFLEFKGGHWLSLYGNLWKQNELPPLELRTMTQDAPDRASVPDDVPSGALATAGFYSRLLVAWVAMGFKVPNVAVNGAIDA